MTHPPKKICPKERWASALLVRLWKESRRLVKSDSSDSEGEGLVLESESIEGISIYIFGVGRGNGRLGQGERGEPRAVCMWG